MNKVSKSLIMLSILIVMIFMSSTVLATAVDPGDLTLGGTDTDTSVITNIGGSLITILSTAGAVISVIVLIVLGLKYMIGSAEEKAEYKKTLIPYIVGAALIFGASSIATMVFAMIQSSTGA